MSTIKRKYSTTVQVGLTAGRKLTVNGSEADDGDGYLKQKRSRGSAAGDCEHEAKRNQTVDPILPSVEDLLSVPTAFIFRKVPPSSLHNVEGNRKPLLSRSEAQCFCKINLLAHEIDCLTQICTQIWQTQLQCQAFSQSLEAVDHPFLRPLLVLLHKFTQQTPSSALPQIAVELNRVVSELQQAAVTLRQCSEQNWALAESLQDTATAGHLLALEKQKLSDVQEEICHRIDQLIARSASCTDAMDITGSDDQCSNMSTGTSRRGSTGPMVSMDEYCSRIFAAEAEIPVTREANDGDYGDNNKDEILSEPEDDAELVPNTNCDESQGQGTMPHQTPLPPQQKSTTSVSAQLFFHSTMSSTPQATQGNANDLSKSRVGSEEKENSQQSQRSSQSAAASNHRHHRSAADALANTFHATRELMSGDEFDQHGADSQDAAHVLSALAATTMEWASDFCGPAVRSSPSGRP